MIATADIGREACRLLVTGWTGKRVVELGSQVSPDDLARAMAEVLGRPVQARAIVRGDWTTRLAAMGLPSGTAIPLPLLGAMLPSIARGAAPNGPVRYVFVYQIIGMVKDGWKPATVDKNFELNSSLASLAAKADPKQSQGPAVNWSLQPLGRSCNWRLSYPPVEAPPADRSNLRRTIQNQRETGYNRD